MLEGREAYWNHMPAPKMRTNQIAQLVLQDIPHNLCDFGCGNGALIKSLANRLPSISYYGIDISDQQIAFNKKNNPNVHWSCADLSYSDFIYPFENSPQIIVSSEVIEHIDDHKSYINNLYNSLEGGGRIILTTQSGKVYPTEKYVGHVKHWGTQEMFNLLQSSSFKDIKVWSMGYPFHNLSKKIANINPEKTIKQFGISHYGIYQRFICYLLSFLFLFNSKYNGAQLIATARK